MNTRMGKKIRALRKSRNLSQEVLAQYLGVSFQAVSKWENGTAMPDVALIPAIASFFDISTDELFDYNTLETERRVQQACWDIAEFRETEPDRAERMLRDLLKQYPGNDIILCNLLYVLQILGRHAELIDLCKTVIQTTKDDGSRYDAARIMAEAYQDMGEYALCKAAIDMIPEFFFSHREEKALLLEGEDMFRPAWQQKDQSLDSFILMTMRIADYYVSTGEKDNARQQLQQASQVILLLRDDAVPPFWKENYFTSDGEKRLAELERRLEALDRPGGTPVGSPSYYRRFS